MKKYLTILLLLFVSIGFAQERRLALVVGNSEYLGKGNSLANPAHDAEDVSAKLKTLGFDVDTLIDGSLLQMDDAIDALGRKAKDYDVVLFYYSGHGMQSKGDNYLVPVDAELRSEADIKYKCTAVNHLIAKLEESGCPMKIIVLDACRNNPFEMSWYKGIGAKGFSQVTAPKGTLIAYATAPGRTAEDGIGRNSPYTSAFLESLDIPNLSLSDFFDNVGTLVLEKTNDEQEPWYSKSAFKNPRFYFNAKATPAPVVAQATTSTVPTQPTQQKPSTTQPQPQTVSAPVITPTQSSHEPPTDTKNGTYTYTSNGLAFVILPKTVSAPVNANSHEYVDLGLPSGTLWATCNLGATKPEDYGNYYAWGETNTKSTYNWSTYKYANGDNKKLTRYCTKSRYGDNGFTDNLTELQSGYDPATANWGNGWQTPTKAQWDELLSNTTNQGTTRNGVKGLLFTSKKNGQTIFLPAAGSCWDSGDRYTGSECYYWSRSLHTDYPFAAWGLTFCCSGDCGMYYYGRGNGFTVRPVRQK